MENIPEDTELDSIKANNYYIFYKYFKRDIVEFINGLREIWPETTHLICSKRLYSEVDVKWLIVSYTLPVKFHPDNYQNLNIIEQMIGGMEKFSYGYVHIFSTAKSRIEYWTVRLHIAYYK